MVKHIYQAPEIELQDIQLENTILSGNLKNMGNTNAVSADTFDID